MPKRSVRHVVHILVILLVAGCAATPPAGRVPTGRISAARIAEHVRFLADDRMQGRAPAGPGEAPTTQYIADALRSYGLSPLPGSDWQIPVPIEFSTPSAGEIDANGMHLSNNSSVAIRAKAPLPSVSYDGDLVFVGYGIHAPELGRDDYAGIDVAGKVVAVLGALPPWPGLVPDAIVQQSRRAEKLAVASARGARGVIVLYDMSTDDGNWHATRDYVGRRTGYVASTHRFDRLPDINVALDRASSERLLAAFGQSYDALVRAASRPASALLGQVSIRASNRHERLQSNNVAGMIRGSRQPTEYVVYVAHWDHLGHCGDTFDSICNGAVDNASGVGGLLELARAFADMPPPSRSVVFLATTAEEQGLLGAEHFVQQGPIPKQRMVAAFGLDTIAAAGVTDKLVILGRGLSDLDAVIERAAAAQRRKIVNVAGASDFYDRSDHFAFAEAGVPAVVATGIFADTATFERFMTDRYHQAGDEWDAGIDYRGAVQDLELVLAAGTGIANAPAAPRWAPNSPYRSRP